MRRYVSVLLVTEGTYPGSMGGVSTWCQRLVTGMPQIEFKIVCISDGPSRAQTFQLPPNVSELTILPIGSTDEIYYKFSSDSNFRKEVYEIDFQKSTCPSKEKKRFYLSNNGTKSETLFEMALKKILMFPVPETDIINAMNSGLAGLLGLKAKKQHRIPLLITEHGSYYKEWLLSARLGECISKERCWGSDLKNLGHPITILDHVNQLVRSTLRGADLVLPVTSSHIPWELYFGTKPERIKLIPNGINADNFQPKAIENTDNVMIGSLCRITPIKDIHTLILAAHHVIQLIPRAEFHLIGPIENKQYYMSCCAMIENLGLESRFLIHKATKEPQEWYQQFDLFTLSSISEGMPLSLLEAMATGIPTVVSDVGGNRETTRGLGTIVPAQRPDKLARGIQRTLRLNKQKKGLQSRQLVQKIFSESQLIQNYVDLYTCLSKIG
ncbi:MAG: GT4 family glycosyltransferase PelF [Candidatus Hodarchaeota archaeon]